MVTIEVEGTALVLKALDKVEKDILSNLPQQYNQIASFMEGEVKLSIAGQRGEHRSVDTGRFMNSVQGRFGNDFALVFTPLEYPLYLEYGTRNIQPRWHFHNSLIRNRIKIQEYLNEAIKSALK
jgi:phage gpG-like protein